MSCFYNTVKVARSPCVVSTYGTPLRDFYCVRLQFIVTPLERKYEVFSPTHWEARSPAHRVLRTVPVLAHNDEAIAFVDCTCPVVLAGHWMKNFEGHLANGDRRR